MYPIFSPSAPPPPLDDRRRGFWNDISFRSTVSLFIDIFGTTPVSLKQKKKHRRDFRGPSAFVGAAVRRCAREPNKHREPRKFRSRTSVPGNISRSVLDRPPNTVGEKCPNGTNHQLTKRPRTDRKRSVTETCRERVSRSRPVLVCGSTRTRNLNTGPSCP